jgi:hypothetical protein
MDENNVFILYISKWQDEIIRDEKRETSCEYITNKDERMKKEMAS